MRLRAFLVLCLAAITAFALPVSAEAKKRKKPPKITVMTRNLYLGSGLTAALTAPNQPALFEEAAKILANVEATNFPARANQIAREVASANPDLIGLQEVALWRLDTDGPPDGPATPATEVAYDFLALLRAELAEHGMNYRLVVRQREADFEIPVDTNVNGAFDPPTFDGRLTMYDAILAKDTRKLKLRNARGANYNIRLPVDLPPAGPGAEDLLVPRGYVAVDVKKKGKRPKKGKRRKGKLRFINTHLEAFSAFIRKGQASELVGPGGPVETKRPVVLVGDLNSDPADPSVVPSPPEPVATPNAAAYELIAGAGFVDRGVSVNTCCHADDLLNPPPAAFTSRIDHVLTKPRLRRVRSGLVGADPAERTSGGLWPSDHGGVFSRLKLKRTKR